MKIIAARWIIDADTDRACAKLARRARRMSPGARGSRALLDSVSISRPDIWRRRRGWTLSKPDARRPWPLDDVDLGGSWGLANELPHPSTADVMIPIEQDRGST